MTAPPPSSEADTGAPLLSVTDLRTYFHTDAGVARSVDGVSFDVGRGETVGLVGESGCGKSVTALSLLRLVRRPGRIEAGSSVRFDGTELLSLDESAMRRIRGNRIAMVFQEPMSALNPVFTVGDQIAEVARVHEKVSRKAAWARAVEMLTLTGIPAPEQRATEYPHQLSGGMRQRVLIAMALMMNPALIIADEPTTALDVTIQAQILELLADLQQRLGTSILMITHDLGVIAGMATARGRDVRRPGGGGGGRGAAVRGAAPPVHRGSAAGHAAAGRAARAARRHSRHGAAAHRTGRWAAAFTTAARMRGSGACRSRRRSTRSARDIARAATWPWNRSAAPPRTSRSCCRTRHDRRRDGTRRRPRAARPHAAALGPRAREALPHPKGRVRPHRRPGARGGRRVVRRLSRRDAGTRRRIRLRQIHHRPARSCACSSRPPAASTSTARTC